MLLLVKLILKHVLLPLFIIFLSRDNSQKAVSASRGTPGAGCWKCKNNKLAEETWVNRVFNCCTRPRSHAESWRQRFRFSSSPLLVEIQQDWPDFAQSRCAQRWIFFSNYYSSVVQCCIRRTLPVVSVLTSRINQTQFAKCRYWYSLWTFCFSVAQVTLSIALFPSMG